MRPFGKFQLVEHLASGGMADVWRAQRIGSAGFVKEVALKLVKGEHRADDRFTRMFLQEARLASRLDHANVVHVYELGEVDGQFYLAMELVRGRTLREVIDRARELGVRFGVARAVHVAAEVARGLAYAHRLEIDGAPAGLVHRDVSPQNVLVSWEGEVKLADFGIARAAGAAEQTRPGVLKGKLAYMAPEQARGEPVDARADVFALGAILWELCAGRRLFAREGDAATLAAVLDPAPVTPASAWNEAVPPELDAVVRAALERDPARRTSTADQLASELAALRLRLADGADELDLRTFMRRLWPEGPGAPPAAPAERTAVRAAAPEIGASEGASPAPESTADAATRTSASAPAPVITRPRTPRRAAAATLAILLGVAVLWGALRLAGAPSPAEPAPPRDAQSSSPPAAPHEPPAAPPGRVPPAPAPPGDTVPAPAPQAQPARTTPAPAPSAPAQVAPRPASARGKAAAGTATLVVHAEPWATVWVDGVRAGDTPLTLRLSAGRHTLRAEHPRFGAATHTLELEAGQRRQWTARLSR